MFKIQEGLEGTEKEYVVYLTEFTSQATSYKCLLLGREHLKIEIIQTKHLKSSLLL